MKTRCSPRYKSYGSCHLCAVFAMVHKLEGSNRYTENSTSAFWRTLTVTFEPQSKLPQTGDQRHRRVQKRTLKDISVSTAKLCSQRPSRRSISAWPWRMLSYHFRVSFRSSTSCWVFYDGHTDQQQLTTVDVDAGQSIVARLEGYNAIGRRGADRDGTSWTA
eukprot:scaffold5305_cov164-Amphora_coffeaeformis.AAC.2